MWRRSILLIAILTLNACDAGQSHGPTPVTSVASTVANNNESTGPTSTLVEDPGVRSTTSSTRSPTTTSTVAPKPTIPVSELETGIHVLWYHNAEESRAVTDVKRRQILDYVVDIGANSVMLSFPLFMDGYRAVSVTAGETTPPVEELAMFVADAKGRNLRVAIRPLIDEHVFVREGKWRGTINPQQRSQWFQSYADTLKPFLEMAEGGGVDEFVIGVELNSLTDDEGWGVVVQAVRDSFSGKLSYSSNWNSGQPGTIEEELDSYGLDAYFPIDVPPAAEVEELVEGWRYWLDWLSQREVSLSSVVVHEVGLPSQPGLYKRPWSWGNAGNSVVDWESQYRWFESACIAFKDAGVRGIYWWRLDFHQDFGYNPAEDAGASFVGKKSEEAIRDCFSP